MKKTIYFTVTNDLTYDQRMQRICTSLSNAGYPVFLVGRKRKCSRPLLQAPYKQIRLRCFFDSGKLFYAAYNIRLFLLLLFRKADAVCAIDLDSILPVYLVTGLKKVKRIYDAHELFTELKEIKSRPPIYKAWKWIERKTVPRFGYGYTVCDSIANELKQMYNVHYDTIRNVPFAKNLTDTPKEKTFIYTGAVNEGRGFEFLIPAMQTVNYKLIVCGDGNFMQQARYLTKKYGVENKVVFKGMLLPADLETELAKAYIGINLVENAGLNQYYSLPNKLFDYIQQAVPQITMDYPEYRKINDQYRVGILISDLNTEELAAAMNNLMEDVVLYQALKNNCLKARLELTWQHEEKKILHFYEHLFNS
ncbi:MAG: glycosyltransferase [Niabella sp.]